MRAHGIRLQLYIRLDSNHSSDTQSFPKSHPLDTLLNSRVLVIDLNRRCHSLTSPWASCLRSSMSSATHSILRMTISIPINSPVLLSYDSLMHFLIHSVWQVEKVNNSGRGKTAIGIRTFTKLRHNHWCIQHHAIPTQRSYLDRSPNAGLIGSIHQQCHLTITNSFLHIIGRMLTTRNQV